jgi:hypothetical protein
VALLVLQVVDEIVKLLTDVKFMGKMVVILAGYEAPIEELMAINPGLKSRFSEKMFFPDFSIHDACNLLVKSIDKEHSLRLTPEAQEQLPLLMAQVSVDIQPDFFEDGMQTFQQIQAV